MKKTLAIAVVMIIMLFSVSFAANFSDVPSDHWAYKAIDKMVENGVVAGYPDGTFGPDKMVTRAEFAKIVVSTLNLDMTDADLVQKFDDVGRNHWAFKYVNVASDFLTGYKEKGKTLFLPEVASVREDIAVAIVIASKMNYYTYNANSLNQFSDVDSISKNLRKYVAIALENDLIHGYEDGTFRPQANLTRAQVCQLMVNLLDVREKIVMAEQENDNKIKLPNFKYDEKTGTVDLGENWQNYVYSFGDSKRTSGWTYVPSQRVLTIGAHENDYGGKYVDQQRFFFGKYLYIMDRNEKWNNYKLLTITDPFKAVVKEYESGKIDLGSNYKDFVYCFTYTSAGFNAGTIYEPSQRRLIADGYGNRKFQNQSSGYDKYNGFVLDQGFYVKVMLKNNLDAAYILEMPSKDSIQPEEPEFVYDANTGTIDLGENWQNYVYAFGDTKRSSGWTYVPSQRVLTIGAHQDKNGGLSVDDTKTFFGKYVFIMDKKEMWNNFQVLAIKNPFAEVTTQFENGKIDLGSNYKNFYYSFTYINYGYNGGTVYEPSQRYLIAEGMGSVSGQSQSNGYDKYNGFCLDDGLFVKVFLRNNREAAFIIDTPRKSAVEDVFADIVYDVKNLKLDLGANWSKFEYTRYDKNSNTYYPSQRTLNYTGGANPSDRKSNCFDLFQYDKEMQLKVMLKDDHSRFTVISMKNPLYAKLESAKYEDGILYAKYEIDFANDVKGNTFYVDGKAVYGNDFSSGTRKAATEKISLPNLTVGKHRVYMTALDSKGNTQMTYTKEFEIGNVEPISVTHNIPSTVYYNSDTYKITFSRALYANELRVLSIYAGSQGVVLNPTKETDTTLEITAKSIFDTIEAHQKHLGNLDLNDCTIRFEISVDNDYTVDYSKEFNVRLIKEQPMEITLKTSNSLSRSANATVTLNRALSSSNKEKVAVNFDIFDQTGAQHTYTLLSTSSLSNNKYTIKASALYEKLENDAQTFLKGNNPSKLQLNAYVYIDGGNKILSQQKVDIQMPDYMNMVVTSSVPKTFKETDTITMTLNRPVGSSEKLYVFYQYSPKGGGTSITGATVSGRKITIPGSKLIATYNASKANDGALQDNKGVFTIELELNKGNTTKVIGTYSITLTK